MGGAAGYETNCHATSLITFLDALIHNSRDHVRPPLSIGGSGQVTCSLRNSNLGQTLYVIPTESALGLATVALFLVLSRRSLYS